MFLHAYVYPTDWSNANQLTEPWFKCEIEANPITETDIVYEYNNEEPDFELILDGATSKDADFSKCMDKIGNEPSLTIGANYEWLRIGQ